jgi:hypothetical protein
LVGSDNYFSPGNVEDLDVYAFATPCVEDVDDKRILPEPKNTKKGEKGSRLNLQQKEKRVTSKSSTKRRKGVFRSL